MIRRPPRSTLFPTRRSSDLPLTKRGLARLLEPFGVRPKQLWMNGQKVDRKSTRLNSSHSQISYAVFCLKKKNTASKHKPIDEIALPQNSNTPRRLHVSLLRH